MAAAAAAMRHSASDKAIGSKGPAGAGDSALQGHSTCSTTPSLLKQPSMPDSSKSAFLQQVTIHQRLCKHWSDLGYHPHRPTVDQGFTDASTKSTLLTEAGHFHIECG